MTTNYYVRIRGKVHGPFTEEKVKNLVRTGKVSRVHELSLDKSDWKSANEFPTLFTSEQKQKNWRDRPQSEKSDTTPSDQPPDQSWYYAIDSDKHGPVTLDNMMALTAVGTITVDTLVWTNGMDKWSAAGTVPQVASLFPDLKSHNVKTENTSAETLSEHVISNVTGALGWISLLLGSSTLAGFALLAMGFWVTAIAFDHGMGSEMSIGLSLTVFAVVLLAGCALLWGYRRELLRLIREKDQATLCRSAKQLNRIWMYLGVLVIVGMAFLTVALITAVSNSVWISNI